LYLVRKAITALMKPRTIANADQAVVVATWLHTAGD